MAASQIRRWGAMYYVVVHCSKKGCEATWKSSYFQDKERAETYERGVSPRARCLNHTRPRAAQAEPPA